MRSDDYEMDELTNDRRVPGAGGGLPQDGPRCDAPRSAWSSMCGRARPRPCGRARMPEAGDMDPYRSARPTGEPTANCYVVIPAGNIGEYTDAATATPAALTILAVSGDAGASAPRNLSLTPGGGTDNRGVGRPRDAGRKSRGLHRPVPGVGKHDLDRLSAHRLHDREPRNRGQPHRHHHRPGRGDLRGAGGERCSPRARATSWAASPRR